MNQIIKNEAIRILTSTSFRITNLYTDYALMLNSFDISKNRYLEMTKNITLSTTTNIPNELRLEPEIDVTFLKNELVDNYANALPKHFNKIFIIETVSLMDACFEDIFEFSLPVLFVNLTCNVIDNKVRSAWTENNNGVSLIRDFFILQMNLQPLPRLVSTPDDVFDRYEELRILRHALVHNEGKLNSKHVARLNILKTRFPNIPNAAMTTMSDQLLPNGISIGSEVLVRANHIFALRKWSLVTLNYFSDSFTIS